MGLYNHGYRAYDEVRDDPELPFSCRNGYARLPPPLPQPPPAEPTDDPTPTGDEEDPDNPEAAGFDALDVLPLSPPPDAAEAAAARVAAERSAAAPPGLEGEAGGPAEEAFLPEKEFRERARALMDALGEAERARDERRAREAAWEEEWDRELAGEAPAEGKPRAHGMPAGEQAWAGWYSCEVAALGGGA